MANNIMLQSFLNTYTQGKLKQKQEKESLAGQQQEAQSELDYKAKLEAEAAARDFEYKKAIEELRAKNDLDVAATRTKNSQMLSFSSMNSWLDDQIKSIDSVISSYGGNVPPEQQYLFAQRDALKNQKDELGYIVFPELARYAPGAQQTNGIPMTYGQTFSDLITPTPKPMQATGNAAISQPSGEATLDVLGDMPFAVQPPKPFATTPAQAKPSVPAKTISNKPAKTTLPVGIPGYAVSSDGTLSVDTAYSLKEKAINSERDRLAGERYKAQQIVNDEKQPAATRNEQRKRVLELDSDIAAQDKQLADLKIDASKTLASSSKSEEKEAYQKQRDIMSDTGARTDVPSRAIDSLNSLYTNNLDGKWSLPENAGAYNDQLKKIAMREGFYNNNRVYNEFVNKAEAMRQKAVADGNKIRTAWASKIEQINKKYDKQIDDMIQKQAYSKYLTSEEQKTLVKKFKDAKKQGKSFDLMNAMNELAKSKINKQRKDELDKNYKQNWPKVKKYFAPEKTK